MDFSASKPKRQSEPALPMINVVFLLLIFFLMSAQIVSPPPFELTPPTSQEAEHAQAEQRLHISAEGDLALGANIEDAVWGALAEVQTPGETPLLIRADAGLEAAKLARTLTRLTELGFTQLRLATVPQ